MKKLILLLALFSCTPKIDGWKVYKIHKGQHDNSIELRTLSREVLTYEVKFPNESYQFEDSSYQDSWNKLPGFWRGKHHAMFTWRYYNGLELGAHYHAKDTINYVYLCKIEPDKPYLMQIAKTYYGVRFRIMTDVLIADTVLPGNIDGITGRSGVWFGGKYPAPEDLIVYIKYWK